MIGRTLFFAVALAAAMGIPYVLTSSQSLRERATQWLQGENDESLAAGGDVSAAEVGGRATASKRGRLASSDPIEKPAGPPASDFGEIFRFDITPAWVLGRWPRVTTQLPELELQGYRVPLVTGTREDDLAGSLTYYFNREQKLQRIVFFGTTGDARRLVSFLVSRFGFERELKADPGLFLYQVKWSGKPVSELRVRPADVVSAANPRARFEVALAIERPRGADRPQPFSFSGKRAAPDPGAGLFAPHAGPTAPPVGTTAAPTQRAAPPAGQTVAPTYRPQPVVPGAGSMPAPPAVGTSTSQKGFSLWSLLPSWFSKPRSTAPPAAVPAPGNAALPPARPTATTGQYLPAPSAAGANSGLPWYGQRAAPAAVP